MKHHDEYLGNAKGQFSDSIYNDSNFTSLAAELTSTSLFKHVSTYICNLGSNSVIQSDSL